MDQEMIHQLHKENWDKTKRILPHSLSLPFLTTQPGDEAYADLHHALTGERKDTGVRDPKVPSCLTSIFPGTFINLNFRFGGVDVPPACLEDTLEMTGMGLLHEHIHEVLRAQALIYGLPLLFENSHPDIANVFYWFTEYVAHTRTVQIIEEEGGKRDDYYGLVIKVYNPRARSILRASRPSMENRSEVYDAGEISQDEELRLTIEQHSAFFEKTKEDDIIRDFFACLEKYMDLFHVDDTLRKRCRGAYLQICQMSHLVQRRLYDGSWERIEPVVMPNL